MKTTERTPISRRTLLVSLIAAPALAAVVAACGDPDQGPAGTIPDSGPDSTDAPATIAHPTGAADVVIGYGFEGGFVAPGTMFVHLPTVLVSGDGKVYTPGVTTMEYPGPLVAPIAVRTITEAGIQTLLAAADEAGLLAPPPDYTAETNVADVPDTVVTIHAGGQTYRHSAYALGFGTDAQGNPTPESTPARAALQGFTLLLGDLQTAVGADQLGPEAVFEPSEYRLHAEPTNEADLGVTGLGGTDTPPTIVDWPVATGLDLATAAECARLTAEAAGSVFTDADSNTYFRQGDALYRISVGAVLPGDGAC